MGAILIIGLIEIAIGAGALVFLQTREGASRSAVIETLQKEQQERWSFVQAFEDTFKEMVWWGTVRKTFNELVEVRELMKLERGRVTITQAELETVENRLRELDEVDREIQASGLETKEELRILNKKEKDLRNKNEQLKAKILEANAKIDAILSQFESNSQIGMQIENMKTELLRTEQKTDELLIQVELGNEQYFTLKQVYDALDIEYAQLYEKFSESNSG